MSVRALSNLPNPEPRQAFLEHAATLSAPSVDDEAWRYSQIAELDIGSFEPVATPPVAAVVDSFLVGERAATVHVVDGFVQLVKVADRWIDSGLAIGPGGSNGLSATALAGEETNLDAIGMAWCPNELVIEIADGLTVDEPVVVINHHTGGHTATFPFIRVQAGAGSQASVLEFVTSTTDGLVIPTVSLDCGDEASLHFLSVQDLDVTTVAMGRTDVHLGARAAMTGGVAAFGGRYARVRTDVDLAGAGAEVNLVAMYYGTGSQVHDFRTFVHHTGPKTTSNLLFKGTVDDSAGNVYTGMVKIHPGGAGSNSDQTNRNIKLSEDAWAWSVPNLEIENSDVKCSHASSVTPVDADQRFYLHSRGVPPEVADRLIIEGFFRSALEQLPVAGAAAEVAGLLEAKLSSGLFAGSGAQ